MLDHTLRFVTLDVFTGTRFGGNQLAVVFDADDVPTETMQLVAAEFNLSETVFVQTPADPANDHKLRIFTPNVELPFAGHPTIGAALALAGDRTSVRLEEGAGVIVVELDQQDDRPARATLTAAEPLEVRDEEVTVEVAASVLRLAPDEIDGSPTGASAGLPFLFVELTSLDALARAQLDLDAWRHHLVDAWTRGVYLYTSDGQPDGVYRSRMFGPAVGVMEDPATGSAATALAGLLASRTAIATAELRWTVHQGVEMGRPSELDLSAMKTDGDVTACRVGGGAVAVSRGELEL